MFSVKRTQPTQPLKNSDKAARSTNADPIPLETKSLPASPASSRGEQSPSTIKHPQSPFSTGGPQVRNHVKKMPQGKLFRGGAAPTNHMPLAGTRGSLGGTQSHCRPGDYITSYPSLPDRPSPQQRSRRLLALPPQPSRGVVPIM